MRGLRYVLLPFQFSVFGGWEFMESIDENGSGANFVFQVMV